MDLPNGTFEIGPDQGTIVLRTFRQGAASAVGHDLTIEVRRWSGSVTLDADAPERSSAAARLEVGSFTVREGKGGIKPLSDDDKREIKKNMTEKSLQASRFPEITFTSTGVSIDGNSAQLSGDLTIKGTSRPVSVALSTSPGDGGIKLTGKTAVLQTTWDIKPYSGLFGALKVRDEVEIELDLLVPTS